MIIKTAAKMVCSNWEIEFKTFSTNPVLKSRTASFQYVGGLDGSFSLKVALQKRREHGLDTWAVFIDSFKICSVFIDLFIDLFKAFDSVPSEGLLGQLPSDVLQTRATCSH